MKTLKKNRAVSLIICAALVLSGLVLGISGTLAARADVTVTFTDPYPGYTEISVGQNAQTSMIGGAYAWSNSNPENLSMSAPANTLRANIVGLKAGTSFISVGSSIGQVIVLEYKVIDPANITSYTLKNGGDGFIAKKNGTLALSTIITTVPSAARNNITWKSLNTAIATVNASGVVTAVADKGVAIIVGEFIDKWGVAQDVHILVGVGISVSDSKLGELLDLLAQAEYELGKVPNPYSDDSLAKLQDAVDKGWIVAGKTDPSDSEINKGINDLKDALNGLEDRIGSGVIKGKDGNYYKPVGYPPNVYMKTDKDGNPTSNPPQYVYNPDGDPGNGKDRPAFPDGNGGYWVEVDPPSNIWQKIRDNGTPDPENLIWGGPNGKPGGGDDKPAKKFGSDYWVDMGQNVFAKVNSSNPTGPLGPLTGGGPSRNPTNGFGTPVYEHNGKYYIGPLGPAGEQYYYGDKPSGGNGLLDSLSTGLQGDDIKYFLVNGVMVPETSLPPSNVSVTISPTTGTYTVGGQPLQFTATVTGNNLISGTGNSAVNWTVSGSGATITNGAFSATTAGTYTVTAAAKDDPTKTATATVTVTVGDIFGSGNGSIVVIDGIEWIKIRGEYWYGLKCVLLMKKDPIEPPMMFSTKTDQEVEFHGTYSAIRYSLANWYNNLNSPTLKSMALTCNPGTAPSVSWPVPHSTMGIYAHIPRKVDVQGLPAELYACGKDYWLAEPTNVSGAGWGYQTIVTQNGSAGTRVNNSTQVYARPIIWVEVP